MKYSIYLLALVLITLTSSCKKEKKEPTTSTNVEYDYSNLKGSYYGIQHSSAVQFTSTTESDQILATDIVANQLTFKNTSFNLVIPQTTSYSNGNPFYTHADLNFSSNFNQIAFDQQYDGGITAINRTFNGTKTTLASTENNEHPLKSQLEGMFILQMIKHEYLNSIDVSYIDTVSVTMSGFNPVIEGKTYSVGSFYTYYKVNSQWQGGPQITDLYWIEDSLYLDYKTISGVNSGPSDTIHHIFSGARL
jgi:hypothetical protein